MKLQRRFVSFAITPLSFILSLPTILYSQQTTGNLEGYAVEKTGIPLQAVNILVSSPDLQGIRGTASDNRGHFQIINLPVGNYNVELSAVGFRKTIYEDVVIRLGSTTNLGIISMEMQAIGLDEVTISGESHVIDPASTITGGNIKSQDFDKLPIGRNYAHIVTILPQANRSYFAGDNINISGATGLENKYFIDGVDVSDPYTGNIGTALPYNFIREVELIAGGYNADIRGSLGGGLNAVTNSGTNNFQVSVFGFYTSNALTGYKKVGINDPSQGNFADYDFGFGLGGPVIRDKLWYYIAYNPTIHRQDWPVPGFGSSVEEIIKHKFAAKINWSLSRQLNFIFTVNGDPLTADIVGLSSIDQATLLLNPDPYFFDYNGGEYNFSLKGNYILGNSIFLNASIDRVIRHQIFEPSTERGRNDIFYRDNLTGIWSGGGKGGWDNFRAGNTIRISGTLILGNHNLKAGTEYKYNNLNVVGSSTNISKNGERDYHKYIERTEAEVGSKIPSVYVQDNWQLSERLNIYAGVRWDTQHLIGSDGKIAQKLDVPLQPRAGFIFLLDDIGSQRIYGSAGRFAQELSLAVPLQNYSDGTLKLNISYDHDPRFDGSGGDTLDMSPSINPEVKNLQGQYFDEFSLGYEGLISEKIKIGIQGMYRTIGAAIDDAFNWDRFEWQLGNPGKGELSDWPLAERNYYALILTMQSISNRHFNWIASYTLSRNYGNYAGLYDAQNHHSLPSQLCDNDDSRFMDNNITGLLPNDRTHVFKFSGYYNFLFGLTAGVSFIAESGVPLSILSATYENAGVRYLQPRGTVGRTDFIWDLSMRLTYNLDLFGFTGSRFIMDISHIVSQRKPVDIDQWKYEYADTDGNPLRENSTYGEPFKYQPPMSVRFGFEVNF